MDTLLYFLLWGGLIFVMMRFGCGAHVTGQGHAHRDDGQAATGGGIRWIAPITDTDPVCGMSLSTKDAKSAVHGGTVYYFCSSKCRETFEASPQTYVTAPPRNEVKAIEHAHG